MRSPLARLILALHAVAIAAVIAGCGGGGYGEGVSLFGRSSTQRIPAMKSAVEARDLANSAEPMVKSLESDDPAERFYAIQGLKRLTGEDLGYTYYEDEPARRPAVNRWKDWLKDRQTEAKND